MQYLILLAITLLAACDRPPKNIALGTLERERIAHTATVNEVVTALPVLPGSKVAKGAILVQLDDTLQKSRVRKAEAEVAQAQAALKKLQTGIRKETIAAARAKVEGSEAIVVESEAGYLRTKKLSENSAVSPAALDKALAARNSSLADLKRAQEELRELTNGSREEDLLEAEAHLDALTAALAIEEKQLADLTITATRDGILDNLPWNLGERVTTGSPLAIVLAGKAPFARIYVPEPYRVKLKINDSLNVHVDGLQKPITGILRWIATEPAFTPYYALNQEERSRLMYLAEVQLPESMAYLPNGIPAQVELP